MQFDVIVMALYRDIWDWCRGKMWVGEATLGCAGLPEWEGWLVLRLSLGPWELVVAVSGS